MKKILALALVLITVMSVLSACSIGGGGTNTVAPQPTEITSESTATPEASAETTAAPTEASEAPSESPTEEATATPDAIPTDISPTTGMVGTTTTYRPIIVQIENEPPARPQQGIQWADVVYETLIEGLDTRFTCLFNDILYMDDAPDVLEVGPVRSSRYYHQWIQGEWDALYVHQGGAETPGKESYIWGESADHIKQRINAAGKNPSNANLIYRRSNTGKALEHTAYTDLRADEEVMNYDPTPRQPFKFYPENYYEDMPEVEKVELAFWSQSQDWLEYRYDSEKDKLIRYMGGKEFIAEETGAALEVQNLIIQYTSASDFPDEGGRKKIEMFGNGPAEFYIHGKHINGTWDRPNSASSPTMYYDENGEEITFAPGNTWIEIHPNNKTVVTTYADGSESVTNIDSTTGSYDSGDEDE